MKALYPAIGLCLVLFIVAASPHGRYGSLHWNTVPGATTISCTDDDSTSDCIYDSGGAAKVIIGTADTTTVDIVTDNGTVVIDGALTQMPLHHGELGQSADPGACTAINVVTTGVFVQVTGFAASHLNGMTDSIDELTISAGSDGDYLAVASISFEGASGDDFEWCMAIDGVEETNCCTHRTTSNNDVGSATLSCILTVAAAEEVSIRVTDNDATPGDPSVCDVTLSLVEIS